MKPLDKNGEDLTGRSRLLRNLLFSWGGYGVTVVSGFIMPRLISDRLGQTTLGVWDFCWSLVSYFGLLQLGMGASIERYVAKYRAVGDVEALNNCISTLARFYFIVGWITIVFAGATALAIGPIFAHRLGSYLQAAQWAIFFLGLQTGLSFVNTPYAGVIPGCHRWDIHNSITVFESSLILVGMASSVLFGAGLPTLALAHCLVTIAGNIARRRFAFKVCPELVVDFRRASWFVFKEQARFSVKSLVPRAASLLSSQAISILITLYLGPASLAIFSRPRSLVATLSTLTAKFGFIIVPTISSLQSQQNDEGLRRLFRGSIRYLAHIVFPAVIGLAIMGNFIIETWMGRRFVTAGLIPVIAFGTLPSLLQEPIWAILSGMNMHGRVALAKLVAAICSTAMLAFGLAYLKWGLLGAALCFILPQVVVDGLITPLCAMAALGLSPRIFYQDAILKPFLLTLPFTIFMLMSRMFWDQPIRSICFILLAVFSLTAAYWIFLVPDKVKAKAFVRAATAIS